MFDFCIVIVNYKTAQLTVDCLQSLVEQAESLGGRVVVVDNASGDDSVSRIQAAIETNGWGAWAEAVPLPKNGGFAYGNNEAIRYCLSKYGKPQHFILLNPDTVVRPGAMQALLKFAADHPKAGIVGSRLEDPDGTPQQSCFHFPTITSEFEGAVRFGVISQLLRRSIMAQDVSEVACRAQWIAGACILVRNEVFDAIGLLDDRYFMYYEEVDFCRRAGEAGWELWYEPASRVVHLVGQSSGVTDRKIAPRRRPKYWFDSRRRYLLSHHGPICSRAMDLAWIIGHAGWWLRATLMRKEKGDPPRIWLDFITQSTLMRGMST